MTNELRKHIEYIDKLIDTKNIDESDIRYHLTKIKFFQHERLVHLIVTLFFALFTVLFIFLSISCCYLVLGLIFLVIFLFCYVVHYYNLENGVQYLYKQYDEMVKIYYGNKTGKKIFDKIINMIK